MRTFKILGLLLTYPEGSLFEASEDILATLREEAILPEKAIARIATFLTKQQNKDLLDVQEDYVETFDRGRAHCLHLFEHIHGESRDRGQAMVDLIDTYASKALYINNNELPDYLPLFMEYLSRCPFDEARELLGEAIDVIAVISAKLKKRQSVYADVFAVIEVLSAAKPDQAKIKQSLATASPDPQTLEELDEEWREAEAFSGDPLKDSMLDCNSCDVFPNATEALKKMAGGVS
ncbi:nitrate reductase molybdenum cofactor assembly chaperone [Alphaproteobacteria bacterium]|nr:nitrate reductase molybdenum cofactor assembly chaperone [Alphaproteobacteria bacterium]